MQKKNDNILEESKNKADAILLYSESLNNIISLDNKADIKSILNFANNKTINTQILKYKEHNNKIYVKILVSSLDFAFCLNEKPETIIIKNNHDCIKTIILDHYCSFQFKKKENNYILKYKIKRK